VKNTTAQSIMSRDRKGRIDVRKYSIK